MITLSTTPKATPLPNLLGLTGLSLALTPVKWANAQTQADLERFNRILRREWQRRGGASAEIPRSDVHTSDVYTQSPGQSAVYDAPAEADTVAEPEPARKDDIWAGTKQETKETVAPDLYKALDKLKEDLNDATSPTRTGGGPTLIEVLMVVGIASTVCIMALSFYQATTQKAAVRESVHEIQDKINIVHMLWRSQADYAGVSTDALTDMGYPTDTSGWNGSIAIDPVNLNQSMDGVASTPEQGADTLDGFKISLHVPGERHCVDLAHQLWRDSSPEQLVINGQPIGTVANLVSACGDTNTVSMLYR